MMVSKYTYRNLKSMRKGTRLLFFFAFTSSCVFGQTDLKKIKEWKVRDVTMMAEDRLGDFFIVQKIGRIKKYDPDGKVLASTSEKDVTLIEPWYHPSIFIYKRNKQQYVLYGRNFENREGFVVEPSIAIEPFLACPTHDNKLWIFDKADNSVKKVNRYTNEVIQEFEIEPKHIANQAEFTYLREYLNLVFLLDKNSGILILNHLGLVINKIEIKDLKSFYFYGEEIYYLENDKLKFLNLVTEKEHEVNLPTGTQQAIITDERIIILNNSSKVALYTYSLEAQ